MSAAAGAGSTEPDAPRVQRPPRLPPITDPRLQSALRHLPVIQRCLLLLIYEGGMTPGVAGQQLGIDELEVARVLARSLARLARHLASRPGGMGN